VTSTGVSQIPGVPFPLNNGQYGSDKNYFFIPSIGWKKQVCPNLAFGLAVVANGGMNTAWPGENMSAYHAGQAGVNFSQAFLLGTMAYAPRDNLALGLTPLIVMQRLKIDGLGSLAPFSNSPNNLSNNGNDISLGAGVRLGVQYKLIDDLTIAAAYQTQSWMQSIDSYKGILADNGAFNVPSNGNIGFAWRMIPDLMLQFDVKRIWYSDVEAVSTKILPRLADTKMGLPGGSGFGWKDMTIYALGLQADASDKLKLRFGIAYGKQPIPNTEMLLNIIAPAVTEWHLTTGLSWMLSNGGEFKLGLMYAPSKDVTGVNPLDNGQNITLRMHQYELSFGYSA